MDQSKFNEHFDKISGSFSLSTLLDENNVDQYEFLPEQLLLDPNLLHLARGKFNSGTKDIKAFLNPQKNQKYIDLGCFLNLFKYKLHKWPSIYYGVDISNEVVSHLRKGIKREGLKIGKIIRSSLDELPFKDGFFQIASCINVFEYFNLQYSKLAIKEIHRIMKKDGRIILDIPNINHPSCKLMFKIERFFGRKNLFKYPKEKFEKILNNYFLISKIDDSQVMVRYYLIVKK